MILPNNPAIDVDELMKRVRSDAARIRVSGAIEDRRGEPRNSNELTLARALDRHRTVSALLNQAEKENAPRTSVPRRLAALRALRPVVSLALKVFNYAFKQQREFNTSILRADREMIFMQAIIGEAVGRISEELRSMERYRTETFRELKATVGTLSDRLAGLEHSHHFTRTSTEQLEARVYFAHERIDSSEAAIAALATRVETAHARIESTEAAVGPLSGRAEYSHQRIDAAETTLRSLSARFEVTPTNVQIRLDIVDALRDVERRMATANEALLRNDALLRGELLALRQTSAPLAVPDVPAPARSLAGDALHAALGDLFRGDRDLVTQRLAVYLPLVREAGTVSVGRPLLDIGSGRGEWLAALREHGIAARGADSNGLLVNEAILLGLDVAHEDGLQTLQRTAAGTLGAVTVFHVVEHLSLDELCSLLAEAGRALCPGGLLILETPDPRNILVSTRTFYLDPTHRHPIPAELLEFLVETFGFALLEQRQLHAPEKLFAAADSVGETLNTYFSHAQDYAIVARAPQV